jgi:hypothetical protein
MIALKNLNHQAANLFAAPPSRFATVRMFWLMHLEPTFRPAMPFQHLFYLGRSHFATSF